MDGQEAVHGLTVEELGGLNNNNKDDNDVAGVGMDVDKGMGEAELTTAAVVPTGGNSVQGTWRAYVMAAVALFLIVTGMGIYVLTRSVNPLNTSLQ